MPRLTGEQHHVTIPAHDRLKIGTLAAILSDVASHLKLGRDDLNMKCNAPVAEAWSAALSRLKHGFESRRERHFHT